MDATARAEAIPFLFFKQKTAYELRISDWSSDVCSSDLFIGRHCPRHDSVIPGFLARQFSTCQYQVRCQRAPGKAYQALDSALSCDHAEASFGQRKARVKRRHDKVAVQSELKPPANSIAAYGSNHRFGHPADRIQVLQPPGQNRLNCTQHSDVYQVCAYTKVCSRAGENDTKNAVVCHGVGERIQNRFAQLCGHWIATTGVACHCDDAHRPQTFDRDKKVDRKSTRLNSSH